MSILNILNQTFVCLLTNERYKDILDGIYIRSPGSLKGMISRPVYHDEFYHMIKLVIMGRGQKVSYH